MSVILISAFEVPEGTDDEEFLRAWEPAADYVALDFATSSHESASRHD